MPKTTQLLKGHKVAPAVLDLIDSAKEQLVLATAYVQLYSHLEHAIKAAIKRGVPIHCIVREPEGKKLEREKNAKEIAALGALGVQIHMVNRLHAKVYLSESEAIITSFNLVRASQDSVELGVRITDPEIVDECRDALEEYTDGFEAKEDVSTPRRTSRTRSSRKKQDSPAEGFCIGCADSDLAFDPAKPLCRSCYKASRRAKEYDDLPNRVCHLCGKPNKSTLEKPVCYSCYKSLV